MRVVAPDWSPALSRPRVSWVIVRNVETSPSGETGAGWLRPGEDPPPPSGTVWAGIDGAATTESACASEDLRREYPVPEAIRTSATTTTVCHRPPRSAAS